MGEGPLLSGIRPQTEFATARLPSSSQLWSPLTVPKSLCLEPDHSIKTHCRPHSFKRHLINALETAMLEVEKLSGVSLTRQFNSAHNYFVAGQLAKTTPDRQMQTALILSHLIHDLNAKGIAPKLLEIGAGPSFSLPQDYNYRPPWAARLIGLLNKAGGLQAELFCVDPAILPAVETYYGTKAFNVKIDIVPDATIGELVEILSNRQNRNFLQRLYDKRNAAFVEGDLIDRYHDFMRQQTDPCTIDTNQAIYLNFPIRNLQLTAQTWFNPSGFKGSYQECETAYCQHLLENIADAANNAKESAPSIAHALVEEGPYDIIFGQQPPISLHRFLPLLQNGGTICRFPDCNHNPAQYAKKVFNPEKRATPA